MKKRKESMLHPATTHFAIVLPLIALVFSLIYVFRPTEMMSKLSTRFMVVATLFLVIAFFTGREDGSEVYALLSSDGQNLLLEHKDLGLYLTIAMVFATVIKLYGCRIISFRAEVLSLGLLILIALGTLYQGKMGGDLTYTHGANVINHSDGMDCLEDPSEFLEE